NGPPGWAPPLATYGSARLHGVRAEQVAGRDDADEPTLFLEQDVTYVLLHHQLGGLPDGGGRVAPDDPGAGQLLCPCHGGVAALGHASYDVTLGDQALGLVG